MGARSVADVLERAAERLSKPGAWTQGWFAKSAVRKVQADSPRATCWCVLGAIMAELKTPYAFDIPENLPAIAGASDLLDITSWNDAPGRQQHEVVTALKQAAAIARTGEVRHD